LQTNERGESDQIYREDDTVNATDRPVMGPDGIYGTVDTTCWRSLDQKPEDVVDVQLPDGKHRTISADVLIEQKDGSFYVPLKREELDLCPDPSAKRASEEEQHWPCPRDEERRKA
jgi:hypothetical protein